MVNTAIVEKIRKTPLITFGVRQNLDPPRYWFVWTRVPNDPEWRKHCGPHSDREQAVDWINGIRATASISAQEAEGR
jgi:hypothetical protein